jgi:spoIIIJ-associated protein
MAERDLDRYLEGIGIDVDGEDADAHLPDDAAAADLEPAVAPASASGPRDDLDADPDDRRAQGEDEIDFEAALAGLGVGGVVPDDLQPHERAETFLVQLLLYLDPTYVVDVDVDDDGIHVDIHGGEPGRLIGKGGRTLAALEFLTNAVVNKVEDEEPVRVSVDVGGYKKRRDERLRQVAQRAAARARKTGMPVELEPMSAAERRIVHVELADDPTVESESAGEGRDRRVVIYPSEAV